VGDPLECALLESLTSRTLSLSAKRHSGWNIDTISSTFTWSPPVHSEKDLQLQLETDRSSLSAHILLSHPFDATLQRMTVFAMITRDLTDTTRGDTPVLGGGVEDGAVTGLTGGQTPDTEYLIASKGSPESIFECLSAPQREDPAFRDSYFRAFEGLASQGKRVIAFASRSVSRLTLDCSKNNIRADAESNLSFQGFVAFECRLR
jgi:magnesium-transporting ATPase (P-type)